MKVTILLSSYLSSGAGYRLVGTGKKQLEVDTLDNATEEAREWIRRNRMVNAKLPQMRFKVEIFTGDQSAWTYDETQGDPLLQPTAETCPSCPR